MLRYLEKRFPQQRKNIEELFGDDPDFRALCREYEETAQMLAFWIRLSRLPLTQINRQNQDCKEALREMETEILLMLNRQFPPPENGAAEAPENRIGSATRRMGFVK